LTGTLESFFISGSEIEISSVNWAQEGRLLPEDGDRIQSPNVFNKITGWWIMSKMSIIVLTSVGKNGIYAHSENSTLLDGIGTGKL
jgi:hypothetical protein